jgi:hypothetical protein
MESDAAAQGIKDWIGKKMIQINYYRRHHNQGKPHPFIRESKPSQHNRYYEMEYQINDQPWHI